MYLQLLHTPLCLALGCQPVSLQEAQSCTQVTAERGKLAGLCADGTVGPRGAQRSPILPESVYRKLHERGYIFQESFREEGFKQKKQSM